jgi:hypothetical protein
MVKVIATIAMTALCIPMALLAGYNMWNLFIESRVHSTARLNGTGVVWVAVWGTIHLVTTIARIKWAYEDHKALLNSIKSDEDSE